MKEWPSPITVIWLAEENWFCICSEDDWAVPNYIHETHSFHTHTLYQKKKKNLLNSTPLLTFSEIDYNNVYEHSLLDRVSIIISRVYYTLIGPCYKAFFFFFIFHRGWINHGLEDESCIHLRVVNMRSLAALEHWQNTNSLRQWTNGSRAECSRMNLWDPLAHSDSTVYLLSSRLNHTFPPLPPPHLQSLSINSLPFTVSWQTSIIEATLSLRWPIWWPWQDFSWCPLHLRQLMRHLMV